MKSATLRRSTTDKLRFEIIAATHGKPSSTPTLGYALGYGGGSARGDSSQSQQKWYIKGNHIAEVNRWCVAIGRAIEWAQKGKQQHQTNLSQGGRGSPAMQTTPTASGHGHGGKDSESEREGRSLKSLAMGIVQGHGHHFQSGGGGGSRASSLYAYGEANASGSWEEDKTDSVRDVASSRRRTGGTGPVGDLSADVGSDIGGSGDHGYGGDEEYDNADADRDDSESSDDRSVSMHAPPHEGTFAMHGNTMIAQIELAAQLAERFPLIFQSAPPKAPSLSSASSSTSTSSFVSANPNASSFTSNSSVHFQTLHSALLDSLTSAQQLVATYVNMARERDDYWRMKLRHEKERSEVWEESLRIVVREGEELEKELKTRMRGEDGKGKEREGSLGLMPIPTPSRIGATVRRTPSLAASAPLPDSGIGLPGKMGTDVGMPVVVEGVPTSKALPAVPIPGSIDTSAMMSAGKPGPRLLSPTLSAREDESVVDTDEEDEFFDAIEANTLPNVIIADALAHPSAVPQPISIDAAQKLAQWVDVAQYEGYANLRTKLPIEKDTRPPTSLWSVLKHSIGKDLTKISFPVFFNEPTSMLQRMVSVVSVYGLESGADGLFYGDAIRLRIWSSRSAVSISNP